MICLGIPPLARTGVMPGKDLGPVTWERAWDWVPPGKVLGPMTWERTRCEQTDNCENSTFPILRMRAVIISDLTVHGHLLDNHTTENNPRVPIIVKGNPLIRISFTITSNRLRALDLIL